MKRSWKSFACVVLLAACQPSDALLVTDITLDVSFFTVDVGKTALVHAIIEPEFATNQEIVFTSSNPTVATVTSESLTASVKGMKAGTAVITATATESGLQASCRVQVVLQPVAATSMSLNKTSVTITVGSSTSISATVLPTDCTNKKINWRCAPDSVAVISSYGSSYAYVRGKKFGRALLIGVSDSGTFVDTCEILVGDYVGSAAAGVVIGDLMWAPVNCGYDATNYPYGKLYQWGRKYGQAYRAYDGSYYDKPYAYYDITLKPAPTNANVLTNPADNTFYTTNYDFIEGMYGDWYTNGGVSLTGWIAVNTKIGNPCPSGWRVPTAEELETLPLGSALAKDRCIGYAGTNSPDALFGIWMGPDAASKNPTADNPNGCLFFPLPGLRTIQGDGASRNKTGYYWSASVDNYYATNITIDKDLNAQKSRSLRASGYSVRCVKDL